MVEIISFISSNNNGPGSPKYFNMQMASFRPEGITPSKLNMWLSTWVKGIPNALRDVEMFCHVQKIGTYFRFGVFKNKLQELWWKDTWAYRLTFSSGGWVQDARFAWQLVEYPGLYILPFRQLGNVLWTPQHFAKSSFPFSEQIKT